MRKYLIEPYVDFDTINIIKDLEYCVLPLRKKKKKKKKKKMLINTKKKKKKKKRNP